MKNINKILLALYLIKTGEIMAVGVNNYNDARNSEDADKKKNAFLQVVTALLRPLATALLMNHPSHCCNLRLRNYIR